MLILSHWFPAHECVCLISSNTLQITGGYNVSTSIVTLHSISQWASMKIFLTSCLIYIRSLSTNQSESHSIEFISFKRPEGRSFHLVVNPAQKFHKTSLRKPHNASFRLTGSVRKSHYVRRAWQRKENEVFTLVTSNLVFTREMKQVIQKAGIVTKHTPPRDILREFSTGRKKPQTYHLIIANHKASNKTITCLKVGEKRTLPTLHSLTLPACSSESTRQVLPLKPAGIATENSWFTYLSIHSTNIS